MSLNFNNFISDLKPGASLCLQGCVGSSRALILARLLLHIKKPIVLIVSDLKEANQWLEDLRFFVPDNNSVFLFPTLDILPYYNLSPNPDVIMERLGLLWKLGQIRSPFVAIVPLQAALRRLIPRKTFLEKTENITKGQVIERDELINKLSCLAYQRSLIAEDCGSFAVRGGILDIFSPAHPNPFRIEFLDDLVESIRFFDPSTQKTINPHTKSGQPSFGGRDSRLEFTDHLSSFHGSEAFGVGVNLIPAREILMEALPKGWKASLKRLCDHADVSKAERDRIQEFLVNGIYFNGIENYISFFYKNCASLFDYLPNECLLSFSDEGELIRRQNDLLNELNAYRENSTSVEKIFSPKEIFLNLDEVKELTSFFPKIDFTPTPKITVHQGEKREYVSSGSVSQGHNRDPLVWGCSSTKEYQIQTKMESNQFLRDKIKINISKEEALDPLASEINQKRLSSTHIFLVASSLAQRERLSDLLSRYDLPLASLEDKEGISAAIHRVLMSETPSPFIQVVTGPISQGFYWPEESQWWITDEEIFGQKARRVTARPKGEPFSSFSELTPGDYIVHQDHGIGIYKGLKLLEIQKVKNDFLLIEYLGKDKLYVPVDQLDLLSRYSAQERAAPLLDKMGGTTWQKARERVKKATRKLARQLLELQALRKSAKGFAFSGRNTLFEEFEATFPFDETKDQLQAIDEVLQDMEQIKPMDRLVCGDVGYGKTEVALRAAFKVVLDSKQVAVLVPTTVLAFQHYENFKKRFNDYPVNVELLSRFQTFTEQKKIVERLKKGETDIVVATHRLLSNDVGFRDLGLLVIDEEQHFGVAQKEKIKRLKSLTDVLTLSATPIPRTLNFALVGIRDLSLINTPPADRLSIRTYVTHFDAGTIREAILREVKRGGQIYFVHNRIQTIESMKKRLTKIVPEVKIEIAHGQMPEKKLEKVMVDFMEQKFEVLLCTTIIESGLDIPNVNTIIINRADHMGLSQLYQLRGRVGRSFHRAYCYLLIPPAFAESPGRQLWDEFEAGASPEPRRRRAASARYHPKEIQRGKTPMLARRGSHDTLVTDVAKKRLGVIERFTELGSGFKIASHDLEIRGAGNILGAEQSGHIAAIGYDLYAKLLEEAVSELKGDKPLEDIETEMKLPISASIPEFFIPDTQLRLVLYKQLSSLKKEEDCLNLKEEWIDRFSSLPPSVENLISLMRVKILARQLRISLVSFQKEGFIFQIHPSSPIFTDYFLEQMQREPKKYKILSDGKFFIREDEKGEAEILEMARMYLMEMKTTSSLQS